MLFLLIRRVVKRHFGVHLAIPLIVVVIASFSFEWVRVHTGKAADWKAFEKNWLVERLPELAAVYLSFAWVIALSIRKASEVRTARVDTLRDLLPGSTRYFAIGTIALREWFEPNSQLYLDTIVEHQHESRKFRHERVLVFYTNADLKAAQASYLDEPYAKAFDAIHARFKIPLAFLGPNDMRSLLLNLEEETRRTLRCERGSVVWFRSWIPQIPKAWTLRRRPGMLPFAMVEKNGTKIVLRFSKRGDTLTLDKVDNEGESSAYQEFATAIEKKICEPGHHEFKQEFRFTNYLLPGVAD